MKYYRQKKKKKKKDIQSCINHVYRLYINIRVGSHLSTDTPYYSRTDLPVGMSHADILLITDEITVLLACSY